MKLRVEGRNFRLTDTAGRVVQKALTFRLPDLKEFRMSRLFNKCREASEWNSPLKELNV